MLMSQKSVQVTVRYSDLAPKPLVAVEFAGREQHDQFNWHYN
jgi:hypothetical protein